VNLPFVPLGDSLLRFDVAIRRSMRSFSFLFLLKRLLIWTRMAAKSCGKTSGWFQPSCVKSTSWRGMGEAGKSLDAAPSGFKMLAIGWATRRVVEGI